MVWPPSPVTSALTNTSAGRQASLTVGFEFDCRCACVCDSFEDVWLMEVDAIVNTTNEALTERTGCSGSIMFAGGPELATACVHSDPCRTGEAVITVAGRLAAK